MDTEVFFNFLDSLAIEESISNLVPAMLQDPKKFYRTFHIAKRTGGFRKICSPYPSLALIQKKISAIFLSYFSVHSCAFAYRKKSNAIQHAAIHVESDELLTLDLQNFFPNISRQMVFQSLNDRGLSSEISQIIAGLCCLNNGLPQGAATSPILSNIVFCHLDERLLRLASSLGLKYSRYADDLAFSGARIPRSLPKIVESILLPKRFLINHKKTKLKILGAKKIITGVSIAGKILKAPRSFKRNLRAQINEVEKYEHMLAQMPNFDAFIYERIIGKLNYLLQIEPDNVYAQKKKLVLSERHQNFLGLI